MSWNTADRGDPDEDFCFTLMNRLTGITLSQLEEGTYRLLELG
jgi:hypothetical protein